MRYKNQSAPDIDARWDYQKKLIEKEQRLFLCFCSNMDADMLLGKTPMSPENFQRLYYLIDALGLEHYSLALALEKGDLMEKLSDEMEKELESDTLDIKKAVLLQETWIRDFLAQLPNDNCRQYLREIFLI